MAEVRLTPAAERDLEGIWTYTRDEGGPEQADRYLDMLTATFQALAESPKSAPACDHIREGYRRRGVGRHMIYFRVMPRHRRGSRASRADGCSASPLKVPWDLRDWALYS
jgi:toxin ParE1/3/4